MTGRVVAPTQHADDAAALLRTLGLDKVTVFGGSSAGIIAVQLALRHPGLVRRALAYEPGYFLAVPGGDEVHARASAAIEAHLEAHASDWAGAYAAFARAAFPSPHPEGRGFLAPPPGRDWYATREDLNAEALLRDDIPLLTTELPDEAAIAALRVEVRFAYGTASLPIFRKIAEHLAAVRGEVPDVLEGVGHSLYHFPDEAAEYIAQQEMRRRDDQSADLPPADVNTCVDDRRSSAEDGPDAARARGAGETRGP